MTPEGRVKKAITKTLKEFGVYYFMPVQSGLGNKTLDYLVCAGGTFLAIEAKAPGKNPTALQLGYIRDILANGGSTLVIDSTDMTGLRAVLEMLCYLSRFPRDIN